MYVAAPAAERLAALLADAARRPEAVAAALGTAAVGGVLTGDGGGDALRAWLVGVAAAGRIDAVAAATEWIGSGTSMFNGSESAPAAADAFDALGGAAGLADAAAAAAEACPAGDATAASLLGAMLGSLPPAAARWGLYTLKSV